MGNAPNVTLTTYAHVFDEQDGAESFDAVVAILTAREEFAVRGEYAGAAGGDEPESRDPASIEEADARIRTADPFITSVDSLSPPVVPGRGKSYESDEFVPPRWRPKTARDKPVDPA
jgi:hypothetical protein